MREALRLGKNKTLNFHNYFWKIIFFMCLAYLYVCYYFYFRDFVVQENDTKEIRHITQMAYLSWPDHGVPECNEEFVDFVEKVRTCRQGYSLCPTVVHCSAGE